MANVKYDNLGRIMRDCLAWASSGTGFGSQPFNGPEILLMADSFGVNPDPAITTLTNAITDHVAGRADLVNPRRSNRVLLADLTLIGAANPVGGSNSATGILIAADFYDYASGTYTKRPIFFLDDTVSMQLPYVLIGHAVTIQFPSNILYTI